jgi:glycosyltransferase involved in cell wall biosynthesis
VIDGGSSDRTLSSLSEYDGRIAILLSEPDDVIYDAVNKGVRLAKGDYLLFLNAGDYLYDDDALKNISRMPDEDIVYGDLQCLDSTGGSFVIQHPDVRV